MHCCCLHVNYIVYKHFDKSLHVESSDPTCVHNFRHVPLMVFEILGFKLKKNNNDDNKNNCRNGLFAISPMLMIHFKPKILVDIHIDLGYHPAVSKVDYD